MHYIKKTPRNLQAFGICSKSSTNVLHLEDGTNLRQDTNFGGSWGGLVGRYTP